MVVDPTVGKTLIYLIVRPSFLQGLTQEGGFEIKTRLLCYSEIKQLKDPEQKVELNHLVS